MKLLIAILTLLSIFLFSCSRMKWYKEGKYVGNMHKTEVHIATEDTLHDTTYAEIITVEFADDGGYHLYFESLGGSHSHIDKKDWKGKDGFTYTDHGTITLHVDQNKLYYLSSWSWGGSSYTTREFTGFKI